MVYDLKKFVDKIFSINPSFSNVFGSGVPGMAGASVTSVGATSSSSVIINDLRKTTALLAEKVSGGASESEIMGLAQSIEANLLALQSLGQISEDFCKSLINELYSIS